MSICGTAICGGIVNVAYAEWLYYEHLAIKQLNILTVTMR